jgi:hypothetical protein
MAENGALNFPIFVHKISPVDDYGPSVRYLEGLNMKGSDGLPKMGKTISNPSKDSGKR